jgi:LuxR family transcriptional regulator, maltose regulon positive regulatory protein
MTATINGFPPMEACLHPGHTAAPSVPAPCAVVARYELFSRLDRAGNAKVVSAPAGSGKTFLLRSWIGRAPMCGRAAWVSVPDGERDPQRFWIEVADALRATVPGSTLVRPLTAAPDLDGWAIVERLLKDLARLADPVWLVIDDVHELVSAEVLRQLELLVLRAPEHLRFVLAARHDLPLGLHRLRLEGELTEIRAADLRFTLSEARALFDGAGVAVSDAALALLHARTEGWAAGLRLAALSLAGHPDPERFAEEFSGSERTVAGYLMDEVLQRQSEPVRRLLLRTSVLDRVCGELADLLAGEPGAERVLQDLERTGMFVVSLDTQRSWFRYHQLFTDLLRLELRRTSPAEVPRLHRAAAAWFAGHGFPAEAVRHAQAVQDWGLAARLLSDHWVHLYLDGQAATARELLTEFPAAVVTGDAELTTLIALGELDQGSPQEAERYLAHAARRVEDPDRPVPAERRARLEILLSIARLQLAQERVDLQAVAAEAKRLLDCAGMAEGDVPEVDLDLRALAVINLCNTAERDKEEADRRLEQGVALARRIRRPYLELTGLAYGARTAPWQSLALTEQRSRQAIELAERHGWGEDHAAAMACTMLGTALTGQGRPTEGAPWLDRAGQTLRTEAHPASRMHLHYARGLTQMARRRHADALADFRIAEQLSGVFASPRALGLPLLALMLLSHVELGETGHVEAALAGLDDEERRGAYTRTALASLRLAQHDPQAAVAALAPILDGTVSGAEVQTSWAVEALLLESTARDTLGDPDAAGLALERALAAAEPSRVFLPFLLQPVPGLLKRHARQVPERAALITDILSLLRDAHGDASFPPVRSAVVASSEPRLRESLSQAEMRVLRYLPTGLSVSEIADQLYLSVNTVRTHMRHLYDKLGVHRRHEAVDRARALGLLAPAMH